MEDMHVFQEHGFDQLSLFLLQVVYVSPNNFLYSALVFTFPELV